MKQTEIKNEEKTTAARQNMEYIRCNLCEADNTKIYYHKDGMNIVECKECGLIYVNPRINDPNPNNIYDSEYFDYYFLTSHANKKTFAHRLKLLEKYYPQKGDILDVGCSIGDFLEVAKSRGWNPSGIDVSPFLHDWVKENLGFEIQIGDFLEAPYEDDSFDVVHMGDSIEHMLDPSAALEKVRRVLKKDGIGYVRVPDAKAISPRIFGINWIQLKPTEHLFYFTRATMRKMLEQKGFRVLKMGTSGTYLTLNIFLNRLEHYFSADRLNAVIKFFSETLRLGKLRFYFDVLEELEVVFINEKHQA